MSSTPVFVQSQSIEYSITMAKTTGGQNYFSILPPQGFNSTQPYSLVLVSILTRQPQQIFSIFVQSVSILVLYNNSTNRARVLAPLMTGSAVGLLTGIGATDTLIPFSDSIFGYSGYEYSAGSSILIAVNGADPNPYRVYFSQYC
jgi:hypothetical protein